MFEAIAEIIGAALGIWQDTNAVKYQKELLRLKEKFDKENDKEKTDHNILDHN